jgi:hypothetical protein
VGVRHPGWVYGGFGWYPGYPYGWWYPPYPYPYYGRYYGAVASLRIEVTPKDAEVYVDGNLAGIVDQFDGLFQRLDVSPGGHTITLFKPGYRTVNEHVYAQPGTTFRWKYAMEPLGPGETSEPPPVPAQEARPEPGEGPPPQQRWRPVPQPPGPEPRQPRPEPPGPQVRPMDAERFGQLAIRVQPEGAQVLIDGETWQGPRGMERLVVHLPVGVHRVEVRKEGYESFVTEVELRPGEVTALNVSLTGRQ